jgi:deferrochelatase/peroxidase EfeB
VTIEPEDNDPKNEESVSRITRRRLLGTLGAAGAVGAVGAVGGLSASGVAGINADAAGAAPLSSESIISFHGERQAGITNPAPSHAVVAAFDVIAPDRAALQALLESWSLAASRMTRGLPAGPALTTTRLPNDPGEAMGLASSALTITLGVGASLFGTPEQDRFGLASKRPSNLIDLPAFKGDALDAQWSGGDLVVQACAEDEQVAFHAIHALAARSTAFVKLRWMQSGFLGTSSASSARPPRNLLGFHDGIVTPKGTDLESLVWVSSGDQRWMRNGTYLVLRRIRANLTTWDAEVLEEQQEIIGRVRSTGARLDKKSRPNTAHVVQASPEKNNGAQILRRGFNYSAGALPDGSLDAGLIFLGFGNNPAKQFVAIQQRLSERDALNEYITHVGSSIFAILPGAKTGEYLGQSLFS